MNNMDKIESNLEKFLQQQEICIKNMKNKKIELKKIIKILINARNKKKKIFTMGNGGSGSTASHLVSDLLKTTILKNEKRFQAISLVDNIPVILAWSNDVGFEHIFSEQLKNFIEKGDIVIGFSGSGNSQNLLNAFRFAKKNGAVCVGFTGQGGGKMKKYCDYCFEVPSIEMLSIESQHLLLCHSITSTIRNLGKPLFTY